MATKKEGTVDGFVIENYIIARPPIRTTFDIGHWRQALIFAESLNGTRVTLYDLYIDVLLDTHLSAQWNKRIMGITNTDMMFTNNGEDVPEMSDLMDSPEFEEILSEVMQSVGWGKTVMELANKETIEMGKSVRHVDIYSVPRKHIRPKEGTIVKEQYDAATNGINYRTGPSLNYVADIGKNDDLGLLLKAVPYVLLKRGDVGDWAQFVQLFGMPFREYRYNGFDPATEAIIRKNAEEMGSAPYIILPDGATITLHDVKNAGQGGGDVYQKLADFCDKQISILILGNTETTQSSASSGYAQAAVHQDTEDHVYVNDKKKVRRILNRIIKPILYNLGWPVEGGNFTFKEEEDIDARLNKIKLLQAVKALGTPIDDEQVYEDAGLEKPDNYDELKTKMDEEKAAQQQPGLPGQSKKPKAKSKPSDKKMSDQEETFWNKIRITLADFFDPAP